MFLTHFLSHKYTVLVKDKVWGGLVVFWGGAVKQKNRAIRGDTYMTSSLGGGGIPQKKKAREDVWILYCISVPNAEKGGGAKNFTFFADVI